ncbi:hypothetical protein [Paenibacillus polymyxa]|uniref:hypothetical protein n=1 Tax=Paenibacillus polymyxa TaxID=1406 RepID=UPI00287FB92D|nr:hypothetical protein [Paenibacillus polymyxa]
MINKKDVVRMLVPFPNIDSQLALDTHMYICLEEGNQKEFIKCQKFKPTHLISSKPPFNTIVENPDITKNPFNLKTTIDCDKSFIVSNVQVDTRLLTTHRRDVCHELFEDIKAKTDHPQFYTEPIDSDNLCRINRLISKLN